MTSRSETFLGRFGEEIYQLWLEWDLVIVGGVVLIGGIYLLVRWLVWKLPDFFLEQEAEK